jgi:hypothetical protein
MEKKKEEGAKVNKCINEVQFLLQGWANLQDFGARHNNFSYIWQLKTKEDWKAQLFGAHAPQASHPL